MPASVSVLPREQAGDAQVWSVPDVAEEPLAEGGAWHPRTLRQLEETEQRARDEGYARGLDEGRRAATAELAEQVRRIDAIVAALQAPLEALDATVEHELVQLAAIAAERIARHELATSPERILDAVRSALAALPAYARQVRIRLQPGDAALVREHLAPGEGGHAWEILEDPKLSRGGCLVQAEATQIDASVETRIATVLDEVLGRDAAAPPEAA
ncbi:FliH/SctL family protein [Dokdonella sp. MW10]|uniref:FliH/SctL family protein n=1 Tax=Dokdonella sp. MW10 TaxID=2992926 RepID=UPI003F80FB26